MYEDTFDTDWETLSSDGALRRMYALGVAASLGHPDDDEYRRIRGLADSPYARNVLELAFEEGRQRGRRNRRELGGDGDVDDVWETLVSDRGSAPPSSRTTTDADRSTGGVPDAVTRDRLLELSGDDLERVRLPDLLLRDD